MSSSKKRGKGPSPKTPRRQANKIEDVEVGGGLLDATTFDRYKLKGDRDVYGAVEEVSNEVVEKVYQRYGLERPPEDTEDADCWVFPNGVDYRMALSDLPTPSDGIPKLMVLVKLRCQTPMLARSLDINKENLKDGQHKEPQLSNVILAELAKVRKDLDANKEEINSLRVRNDELSVRNNELSVRNDELSVRNDKLSVRNDELMKQVEANHAEVCSLKDKVRSLEDEVHSLKKQHNNDVLKLSSRDDEHEAKVTSLELEVSNHKGKISDLKNQLVEATNEAIRYTNMTTPLLLRILVDMARKKILIGTEFKKWQAYYDTFPNQDACAADVAMRASLPSYLAKFICDSKHKLRRDGNKTAHNAEKEELQGAVQRTTTYRELLQGTFDYLFPTQEDKEDKENDKEDEDNEDSEDDEDDEDEV